MGWVVMSERELNRVEVPAQVDDRRLSVDNASADFPSSEAVSAGWCVGAVLAHIKEEQEKAAPPPQVKPVSAKKGYKKTGRRLPGRPSKMEPNSQRALAEASAAANG